MERKLPDNANLITCGKTSYQHISEEDGKEPAYCKPCGNMLRKEALETLSLQMTEDRSHKEIGHIFKYIIELQKEDRILLAGKGEIFIPSGKCQHGKSCQEEPFIVALGIVPEQGRYKEYNKESIREPVESSVDESVLYHAPEGIRVSESLRKEHGVEDLKERERNERNKYLRFFLVVEAGDILLMAKVSCDNEEDSRIYRVTQI